MRVRGTAAVAVALGLSLALAPLPAYAESAAEVREEVASTQAELETLTERIAEGEAKVRELQEQVDGFAEESIELQTQILHERDQLGDIISASYKDNSDARTLALLLSSKTMDELVSQVYYVQKVSDWQAACIERLNDDKQELDERMAKISQAKDEQKAALADLNQKRATLDEKVAALNERAGQLEAEERAAAQAAAAALVQRAEEEQAPRQAQEQQRQEAVQQAEEAGDVAQAPTQGGSGWVTCVASAYTIEDNTPPGSTATASGIPLDNSVPTVAMPMSMNPAQFYGSTIEISYGGMSVIATVTDCGSMGGGSRGLDLTPAVFRAFGAGSADEWGLRTVSYRFL